MHYDPGDPTRAYIETGSMSFALGVGVAGALFAPFGLGAVLLLGK